MCVKKLQFILMVTTTNVKLIELSDVSQLFLSPHRNKVDPGHTIPCIGNPAGKVLC
jgi:hypothetical protein